MSQQIQINEDKINQIKSQLKIDQIELPFKSYNNVRTFLPNEITNTDDEKLYQIYINFHELQE